MGLGMVAMLSGVMYWKIGSMKVPAYRVLRVIDGDTFETTEKQLIRLADVFAPEPENCGGSEAKDQLIKLIKDKPVYLKVTYRDKYMRLLSFVYTPEGFVNEKMVENGKAVYSLSSAKNPETETLEKAGKTAVEKKLGVYGPECTQIQNTKKPNCVIKGNIRKGGTGKIYSLPGCESYASTIVQLYLGDQWFCTEEEAKKAGFVKAGGCGK